MNTGVIRWHISVASHILLLGIVFAGNASGQTYPLLTADAGVQQITAGADGNMWFTESDANKIGKMTLSGQHTEYAVPTPNAGLGPITSGPDGNIWFGEIGKIGKITPDGKLRNLRLRVAVHMVSPGVRMVAFGSPNVCHPARSVKSLLTGR